MKTNLIRLVLCLLVMVLAFLAPSSARAQWQTQTITLKPGWNAVYLHVDAAYATLDNLISAGNPISEVWLWQPPVSTLQFTESPAQPSAANTQWAVWDRSPVVTDSLVRLIGNAAYLVRNTNSVDFVWSLTGKPVPPRYLWTTTGLNFLGFPTLASSPPDFDAFLLPLPEFQRTAEIYRYLGGELGSNNPARVFSPLFRNTYVRRGEAFWIRRTDAGYNRYYGPVEVELQNGSGVHFGDNVGTYRIRLKNHTAAAQTMRLNLLNSETPPAGQTAIVAPPPLLVRGALNSTNLSYAHTVLATEHSFTLAPLGQAGSEVEVVIGLNRSAMVAAAGGLYAGVLRFTDAAGLSQIDVPVSAIVAATDGLWVGNASATQVAHYLKTYVRDANGNPVQGTLGTNGAAYVAVATNATLGAVARPFPLRLILHHSDAIAKTALLQRVYYGQGRATNTVIATREELLDPSTIGTARRISAAHLPFSHTNTFWPRASGQFRLGTNIVFNILLDANDHASNPFLHTFHPDHDNLRSDFRTVEPQGNESYRMDRQVTLTFAAPSSDFASLTAASQTLGGTYSEVVTISGLSGHARQFSLRGTFSLNRLSPIATLTTQ